MRIIRSFRSKIKIGRMVMKKNIFPEIFDPKTWDNLDNKRRNILTEKWSMRELNLQFPKYNIGRHFFLYFLPQKVK
jgi:hypothetical protein